MDFMALLLVNKNSADKFYDPSYFSCALFSK